MTSEEIEARLLRLERQNRWLRCVGLLVLVGAGAAVLMGQARKPRVIEAEEFRLMRPDGSVAATLYTINGQTRLAFWGATFEQGENGPARRVRAALSAGDHGGMLYIGREDGAPGVMVTADKDGGSLTVSGPGAPKDKSEVSLTGSSVRLSDAEGKPVAGLWVDKGTPALGLGFLGRDGAGPNLQ